MSKNNKKDYSKIEAKDNMKIKEEKDDIPVKESERERLAPVVSKTPTKRKKGLMERLVVGVLGPEGLPGIGAYLNEEIIIPAIKNIIVESVTSGINMAIFGERGSRPTTNYTQNSQRSVYRPHTNYSSSVPRTSRYTSERPDPSVRHREVHRSLRYGVEEYPIPDRMEANNVLTVLIEMADRYDYVSVADYYDLLGVASAHTDHNFGWSYDDILKGSVIPVGREYVVNLPPVTEI